MTAPTGEVTVMLGMRAVYQTGVKQTDRNLAPRLREPDGAVRAVHGMVAPVMHTSDESARRAAVCSWRLPPEEKDVLGHEARRRGASMAVLPSQIVRTRLAERQRDAREDEAEQRRLRAAAMRSLGTISGGDPRRSERSREAVRDRLRSSEPVALGCQAGRRGLCAMDSLH